MNFHTINSAASVAPAGPPTSATAVCPKHASDRGALASLSRAEQFGPPTTSRLEGAGGPFNRWDIDIAAAERRGNHKLAARLRDARARVNLAWGAVEPVWVPTPHQRTMLALRVDATANGFAAVAA